MSSSLKVVIVNGKPGVGKTLVEQLAAEILGQAFCEQRSTVDKVKEIAYKIGWDGIKNLRSRKLLSDLKDICTEYNDMPVNDILNYLKQWENDLRYYGVENHPHIFFIDDREPEHIKRLKSLLDATTLLIRRPGDEEIETSNHADENVFNYDYDWVINNNGTINDLHGEVERFINWLFS